jgi:hypothetical protein
MEWKWKNGVKHKKSTCDSSNKSIFGPFKGQLKSNGLNKRRRRSRDELQKREEHRQDNGCFVEFKPNEESPRRYLHNNVKKSAKLPHVAQQNCRPKASERIVTRCSRQWVSFRVATGLNDDQKIPPINALSNSFPFESIHHIWHRVIKDSSVNTIGIRSRAAIARGGIEASTPPDIKF